MSHIEVWREVLPGVPGRFLFFLMVGAAGLVLDPEAIGFSTKPLIGMVWSSAMFVTELIKETR